MFAYYFTVCMPYERLQDPSIEIEQLYTATSGTTCAADVVVFKQQS